MFVARNLYLISDGRHEDYWNNVINVYVSESALNCLHMHDKRTCVHCSTMLMW